MDFRTTMVYGYNTMNAHAFQLQAPEDKIRSYGEMSRLIRQLSCKGLTVILAQGVFDILHLGHAGYLREAGLVDPSSGVVIVGVENDKSVRLNKGDRRPINPVSDRMELLAELKSTAFVFAYEDTPNYAEPAEYVARYQTLSPAAIVVPVWDPFRELKERQARDAGARLALVDYRHLNSTTCMLRKVGYE